MKTNTLKPITCETTPTINEKLIKKYIPLVKRISRRIAMRFPANIAAEDLYSAGTLGLVDSVLKNREGEGASFNCYVRTRIRGAIYDELRSSDWLPRRVRTNQQDVQKNDGPAKPVAIIRFDDLPFGPESNPINKEIGTDPAVALTVNRTRTSLKEALAELPERDHLIVKLHYFRGMQLREIGRLLGVSEARISQIHHRALQRMRPLLQIAA